MYESRRKRGASGAKGPRIRRPGSTVDRLGSSGNLEKSRRAQDSVSERILGGRKRLSGGASGMYESRRRRGASGANGPRVRRPGSTVNRLGSSGNLEKSRRSRDSVSERIPGARARLSGDASEMYESRRNRGASGADGPRIRRPGSTANRVGSAWGLEKSRRSPGPPSGRIRGARERLRGGASEMYISRRKSGAFGANGPRIRRPISRVSRAGCVPRLWRLR